MKFYRPIPLDKEIKVNPKSFIVSKTDYKGNILYCNDTFSEVTGYDQSEVLGAPHNILRHPDMPRIIFFLMWQRLKSGKNIQALVKNLARTGEYYWVSTDFEIQQDERNNQPTYIAYRRAPSAKAIETISPFIAYCLPLRNNIAWRLLSPTYKGIWMRDTKHLMNLCTPFYNPKG